MSPKYKLIFSVLKNQVLSSSFILLLICFIVSFFLGEKVDAIIILIVFLINSLLGFFQEYKASRAGEKLLNLVKTKVYVFRGGNLLQINADELVLEDIVHFMAGSIIPVDIHVIESDNAFIDDSVRTGETESKRVKMGDNISAGSIVSGGKIVASVLALQENSSITKYKDKLESVKKYSSFDVFVEKIIRYIFIVSLVSLLICMFFLVFVIGKFSLVSFFVFSIAMLVGVLPEMLPLIITIILTRESIELSKHKVIVKRLSSLQSIGALKFLLTDKTGTITENKLKVSFVSDKDNFWEISNYITEGEYERNPMDIAYDEALNSSIAKISNNKKNKITNFEQFNHKLGYEVFYLSDGSKVIRGIIGKVLSICKDFKLKQKVLESALIYEQKGMRVLGLATGIGNVWEFSGFVAFSDPVKETAHESFKIAKEKGIQIKILTGDSKEVAMNVLEELKISYKGENVLSLDKIEVKNISNKELLNTIVFSKCTPENKLELIDRYINLGPVAFLGDGINDALALKRADIGIAVENATDIAKESADIILLEKELNPILKSVNMGRKSIKNILTYITYTLSGNAGTFFSLLIASFFYPVLPMLPIQILLNNLLTDLPLMFILTDNTDKYTYSHVPHFEPQKIIKRLFIFGLISSFFDLLYFQLFKNVSTMEFQTGWFLLSIFAELALILSIRSSRPFWKAPPFTNSFSIAILLSIILPFIFIYKSTIASLFKFTALPFNTLFTILVIVIVYIFTNEFVKYFMRRTNLYNKPI